MAVSFVRGAENAVIKQDSVIFDYLRKIDKDLGDFRVVYFDTRKLDNQTLKPIQRQSLIETFETVVKKSGGEIFGLPNEDIIIFYHRKCQDEVYACLVKVRFMFHDDPVIRNAESLEDVGFVRIYDLGKDDLAFRSAIKESMKVDTPVTGNAEGSRPQKADPRVRPEASLSAFNSTAVKLRKQLTTDMLAKVQKILGVADFSSLMRRQAVCAVIGKAPPQRVFEEVYVSIPDLREMLLPDVDLTADPWLFLSLSETLDKRVLETVSRHDDGSLSGNFSLNINVSTILSDEFLEFDDNISPSMRPTIILELQLVDIFSDIKAFILAKTFAQARGYKICIDGITVDKLKYLNRANLNCDLMKIIWHPTFMDVIHEDKHFMDYVNKAERAKMILCRIDDPQAVEVGNSLGINLYQGRYVQRMLNSQPKRTIFAKR